MKKLIIMTCLILSSVAFADDEQVYGPQDEATQNFDLSKLPKHQQAEESSNMDDPDDQYRIIDPELEARYGDQVEVNKCGRPIKRKDKVTFFVKPGRGGKWFRNCDPQTGMESNVGDYIPTTPTRIRGGKAGRVGVKIPF